MKKTQVVFLAIIFLAAGCNFNFNSGSKPETIPQNQTTNQAEKKVSEPLLHGSSPQAKFTFLQTVEGSSQNQAQTDFYAGQTALEALKLAYAVETKIFTGVGEYVVSIDGKKETVGKNFWAFYVNGKQAQVGAGDYKLKNGDAVEWKLEEIEAYK